MKSVQELEKELAKAKEKELYDKWEKYLTRVKIFTDYLKGKTILSWYRSGAFVLFKVSNVKECYYADREGAYGQWSPKRWLELESSGHIMCNVADDKGKYYDPKIMQNEHPHKFIFQAIIPKRKGQPETLNISKIDFHDISINRSSWGDMAHVYKIGYTEYKEYANDPSYDRSLEFLTSFAFLVPDEIYDLAYKIHEENVKATKNFWTLYKEKIESATQIYKILEKIE